MKLFLYVLTLLGATDMKLQWRFATIEHINPVFAGLIENYPTTPWSQLGCLSVWITHEFR
jgi:hypothetical protein